MWWVLHQVLHWNWNAARYPRLSWMFSHNLKERQQAVSALLRHSRLDCLMVAIRAKGMRTSSLARVPTVCRLIEGRRDPTHSLYCPASKCVYPLSHQRTRSLSEMEMLLCVCGLWWSTSFSPCSANPIRQNWLHPIIRLHTGKIGLCKRGMIA